MGTIGYTSPEQVAARWDASSTINYSAGRIRANNAIIALGAAGDVLVFCGQGIGTADLVIDVNDYSR